MKLNDTVITQKTIEAAVPEIYAGQRHDKKAYSQPALTKFGRVAKLTAALTGSDTDTLGGNDFT